MPGSSRHRHLVTKLEISGLRGKHARRAGSTPWRPPGTARYDAPASTGDNYPTYIG